MRVGILSIQHESNTFIHSATTLAEFEHDVLASGDEILDIFSHSAHEIGGFIAGLAKTDLETVPIFVARAIPGGTIAAETASHLVEKMIEKLQNAGPLDGLLVAPHGAAVAENERDFDGYWLGKIRQTVGPNIPIICTLDMHANVSHSMINACNATISYRTNPHIDQKERGIEAANLMARTLRGEVQPTQAASFPPIAINIEKQHTPSEPCQTILKMADDMLNDDQILTNSFVLGFPYSDVTEMGSSFIVVTHNNPALAQQQADELANSLVDNRERFLASLISIDDAITQVESLEGTVCLLDMGDNIGGGSTADGTSILLAIQQRQGPKAFACLYDPEAAQLAHQAGVGATIGNLAMGGKTDDIHGQPLVANARVLSLHDGKFSESQVRHGGKTNFDMGPTALVETDFGSTMMLNSQRTPPFSLQQLLSCGIDPQDFRILIAKGVQAPVAAYQPVCSHLIRVNTPGSTSADMNSFKYLHRRKPLFPFEDIDAN